MECFAGGKARLRPLRLSFAVHSQEITGIVTQEIGLYPHGTFNRSREENALRSKCGFRSLFLFRLKGDYLLQVPDVYKRQGIDRPSDPFNEGTEGLSIPKIKFIP